jgi:5-methylcytosine-specific restriction endonuclease McrA
MDNYYQSLEWGVMKERRKMEDDYQCQLGLILDWECDNEQLEVHHKTYKRFGNEDMNDLITLCRECHELVTSIERRRRYEKREMPKNDVQRMTPEPNTKEKNDVVQNLKLSDCRCITPSMP